MYGNYVNVRSDTDHYYPVGLVLSRWLYLLFYMVCSLICEVLSCTQHTYILSLWYNLFSGKSQP